MRAPRATVTRMLLSAMAANAALVGAAMAVLWLWSLAIRNASIIDIAWGPAFVAIAWRMLLAPTTVTSLRLALVALVSAWGLRLGVHLGARGIGKSEDRRYRDMREKPGRYFPLWSLVWVFGLQTALILVVALPIESALSAGTIDTNPIGFGIGIAAWCIGVFFEAVGDAQLARFRKDPANDHAVLDRGLWRYTRHPNYFGDCLVWWGLYLVAVSIGAAWWTIVGPITMTVLLVRVSGVTLLEEGMASRRPGYVEYIRCTSSFVPWPRRS